MMLSFKYIALWLSVVIFITAGTPDVLSQDTTIAKLKSYYIPKVCASEKNKEILITVSIGSIKTSDSLLAFDILVKYDQSKIKIEGAVYLNTMSEYTKYRNVNIGFDSNLVRAFAYSDIPFSGTRDLIGFYGVLLTDCIEPIDFELLECDLTDDYKKKYVLEKHLFVNPVKQVDIDKKVEINLDRKEVIFDSVKQQEITGSIKISPYMELDELFFDIYLENPKDFEFMDLQIVNDNAVLDSKTKISDNLYEVKLNIFGDVTKSELFKLFYYSSNSTKVDIISKLKITPKEFSNCHCYNSFDSDSTALISKAKSDTIANVVEEYNKKLNVKYFDGIIEIENEESIEINTINIYDILGNSVYNITVSDRSTLSKFRINKILTTGTYFVKVAGKNIDINKLIVIYN
jgi:hypothetical protein